MFNNIYNALDKYSLEFENSPLVKPTGFREYDARWLFPEDVNLNGITLLGNALGNMITDHKNDNRIIVGHDYRSYSQSIKNALILGLLNAGCEVYDIGLCLSPIAYFAQFELDVPSVAMVTASHNDNGWTGVKMGMNKPMTFVPDEMNELKERVLKLNVKQIKGGQHHFRPDLIDRYFEKLLDRDNFSRKLKIVVACGNGTAGAFAPQIFKKLGAEIIELHCDLNHSFPNYNPNPEDMKMLHDISQKVQEVGADIGLAFDGDGDRCGVIDNQGREIFSDKLGVLLARNISNHHKDAQFVVDVKSTSLFKTDPVLIKNNTQTDYHKTGHSYIKKRTNELGAIAGFEKSGHFFFNNPLGYGYDDGIIAGLSVCDMLCDNLELTMADLYDSLPVTYSSPTMSPYCADEEKYIVVERAIEYFSQKAVSKDFIAGHKIVTENMINGIRLEFDDGSWALIRASSNKPELVIVVESVNSKQDMKNIFDEIKEWLQKQPEVGDFNQEI